MRLRWPGFMTDMDPSSRSFTVALGLSILIHAVVLSIQFKLPGIILDKFVSPSLEVVLVNSKTRAKPVKADVLAQANLDGGGNTDEKRRAKTPLPVLKEAEPGADTKRAAQRVQELEAQQLKMMARLKAEKSVVAPVQAKPVPVPQVPQLPVSGQEMATNALALARMQAQIARQIEEYNQRPRKTFVGSRAQEYRFAQYVEDWRIKVERIGNLNYPDSARGKVYGSLVLTVSIKADGSLEKVEVNRSSGHQILDRAAERIVKMASPYADFPANIRRDTDILVITRTWTFAPGDKLFGE
ncbi:MAG: TonB family protein [Burkholderiales bacterium]|nr:TonB family protein [Burkholderiales bacterium]